MKRLTALAGLVALLVAGGGSGTASAAPVRNCGNVTANYPRAGVYNVTSRVVRCSFARGLAIRWYFRDQRHPRGFSCRVRRVGGGWDVRCTGRGGRVVRFQYYVPS